MVVSEVVSVFHAPKSSRNLAMASSWLWCAMAGASWMEQERSFRFLTMQYLVVSVGWLT